MEVEVIYKCPREQGIEKRSNVTLSHRLLIVVTASGQVADRLKITTKSLYGLKAKFGWPKDQSAEVPKSKLELTPVIEERDV